MGAIQSTVCVQDGAITKPAALPAQQVPGMMVSKVVHACMMLLGDATCLFGGWISTLITISSQDPNHQ